MADRKNQYLKDPSTITILPAPPDTRNEGIAWYEVQLRSSERSARIIAFNSRGSEVEHAEVVGSQPSAGAFRFDAVLLKRNKQTQKFQVHLRRHRKRDVEILLNVAGKELSIKATSSHAKSAQVSGTLPVRLSAGSQHWQRLSDPLAALANALSVRDVDSKSWSCGACVVLATAIVIDAYFAETPPTFAALLAMGATFYENCGGACAWVLESG